MKTAILSDIHGNMEAFASVLNDIKSKNIRRIFCLGDCIGYGPEPDKVLAVIKGKRIATVMGNHELAMTTPEYLAWFNVHAQISLCKTRNMLGPAAMEQIAGFPRFLIHHHARMVHGFPPDLPRMYLFQANEEKLLEAFQQMTEKICFVGHTHQLKRISFDGSNILHRPLDKEIVRLEKDHRHIINVGSVGQPRDGNNNAKYIIWDEFADSIEACFVPYNIAATAAKIKKAGLPQLHAQRLW